MAKIPKTDVNKHKVLIDTYTRALAKQFSESIDIALAAALIGEFPPKLERKNAHKPR